MSVNDRLAWIEPACGLIRDAVEQNIPVIGHCLGGQLFAKALGGTVARNAVKEIGWSAVNIEAAPEEIIRRWLGPLHGLGVATVFQWHGETFSIPAGGSRLFTNDSCANQAVVLGPHLAMQCHVEMTPSLIEAWCEAWNDEVGMLTPRPASVQTPGEMLADIGRRLPAMRKLADQLYGVWVEGLRRN